MAKWLQSCVAVAGLCLASAAMAGVSNDIPSCYGSIKVGVPAPPLSTELFVLIDQTTPLDATLKNTVRENVGRLVQPGTAFVVATFSSFGQGRYLEVLSAGTLEPALPAKVRDDIGVKLLHSFDACLAKQRDFGRNAAAAALNKALSGISPEYTKSDVMGSMRELSYRIRQSAAQDKILFLVSDMLENSGISSFYGHRNVRQLDVPAEIKKAEAGQMLADLGGARVFVLGAGLVQENSSGAAKDSGVYRDPKTMTALRQFWEQYIARSQGRLIEFGAPALVVPVQ